MKIWLDLRFIWDNLYSTFIIELVKTFIKQDKENNFIIYMNSNLEWYNLPNTILKNVWIRNSSLKEQITYLKILKNDKNNLMLFFNHYKPIFYVWNYFTFISSLKEIYYSNFSNSFTKYIYTYLLEKNLKKSTKIICFDKNTNEELIEKFNIEEKKINIITWFFPKLDELKSIGDIKINIRTKYDIKNNFFIYSGWEWVEKNYEKLVYVFEKLKKQWKNIDLVILWETISKNIPLRNLIIKLEMQKNIHFMWVIKPSEKVLFYQNSLWVIFPSFYEPFPFRLTEPLYFNTPIIASDLINIKNIFWDTINYISPISVNNIYEKIEEFMKEKEQKINYEEIKLKYTKENTVNELLKIIK